MTSAGSPVGFTITAGSITVEFAYTTPGLTVSAGYSFASTTYVSCIATSTVVAGIGDQSFSTSPSIPHMIVTITATDSPSASATASDTTCGASKFTDSHTGSTTLGSSVSSSATPIADTSDNPAIPLATGAAQWVAGGAAMVGALPRLKQVLRLQR
ncbi:hypothetical protein BDV39DRAFT_209867 [Aspergillus sergii]|uniref:Uncharacterized protein n=1 Tax=Aspergillus sergii TaxID=1034303 RepID=A0A5N6WN49_9EURO|nr:hypothetical protein BDV39DRAFT_209867 [Aspergillus sergii]